MRITFDPAKRAKTLAERGLDFADAAQIFTGLHATLEDERRGPPHYFHEARPCRRRNTLAPTSGLIPMMRRR
jgi:uncharacterized DUF497 family protein